MKKIFKITSFFLLIALASACSKEEKLNVDYSGFNPDNPSTNTDLDKWLVGTFLDPYNIDVVYRYNRYYHGNTANVAPNKIENVKPTMQIVLDGFIKPYLKVAGAPFTKKYMPKEWVLFGSNAYANTSDPGVAGTAAAGRRITLYGVNDYQPLPNGQFYAWDRHRIMHHEFGHILNQIIAIPPEFETISRGSYKQPYEQTHIDTARKYGFVTSYASGVHTEDYAETISYLLINGQVWYDDWANGSSAVGKARLMQKQSNVVNYFTNLGIDFKALQKEVQLYMKSIDLKETRFAYWLNKRRFPGNANNLIPTFANLTVSTTSDTYIKYGGSAEFATLYNSVKTAVAAQGYALNFLRFNFTSPTTMYVEANFTGGTTTYQSFYPYNVAVNPNTSEVTFTTGTVGGTTAPWVGNANFTRASIQPFLSYLLNNTFVADWLPVNASVEDYMKIGGFTVKGTPTNYFYGTLGY